MIEQILTQIAKIAESDYNESSTPEVERPDEKYGDFSTNIALKIAQKTQANPREIAEKMVAKIAKLEGVKNAEVAGPGFINITLTDVALWQLVEQQPAKSLKDKVVVAEYSDPNPFKVLHAGHLYTSVIGDAIANLLEVAGAIVHRVNFGGDVGLHVANTMWAIIQELGGENPAGLDNIKASKRSDWLSERYVQGTAAYKEDEAVKEQVIKLNKRIYQLHIDNDKESAFAQIYWSCRQWSYDYFNAFYDQIGTHFEKYYPESQTAPIGLKVVQEQLKKGVYQESQGAVVFDGEKYDLHTRVFINSEGLPTYEAKDVGLIMVKWEDYKFDKSVIITGNDIVEYMKVVLKSIEQFEPKLANATSHLTHGMVKLAGGAKMSSRKGNILRAVDVLEAASKASEEHSNQDNKPAVLGAVKYAFLKQRMGGDIIYDPEESVSIVGNSGPYLQYSHARACSILQKSKVPTPTSKESDFQDGERSLVRKLGEYAEVVDRAVEDLMPHHVCTYLYELAQVFNRFYEQNRVIGDERETIRLELVKQYANTLKNGLSLLNTPAPEKM